MQSEKTDLEKLSDNLEKIIEQARAWREINQIAHMAHDYANKYGSGRLGQNVWHIALHDAWNLRRCIEDGILVEKKNVDKT